MDSTALDLFEVVFMKHWIANNMLGEGVYKISSTGLSERKVAKLRESSAWLRLAGA